MFSQKLLPPSGAGKPTSTIISSEQRCRLVCGHGSHEVYLLQRLDDGPCEGEVPLVDGVPLS
eukprot:10546496-Prorocentrum_lima.AAC.1